MDDRTLAERFPSGEDDVMRAVVDRFGGPVTTVVRSVIRDPDLARDVVQTTFVKAWRASDRFDPSRDLGPWLYTIARRAAIDAYRRDRPDAVLDPDAELSTEHDEVPASFERAWEAFQVRTAVEALPSDERDVLRMSHFDGLSHAEISQRIGVPLGTVKSRSHRAHRRLASLLGHLRDPDANQSGAAPVQDEATRMGGTDD